MASIFFSWIINIRRSRVLKYLLSIIIGMPVGYQDMTDRRVECMGDSLKLTTVKRPCRAGPVNNDKKIIVSWF